jgi:L-gulonate 3-dehydrogenase
MQGGEERIAIVGAGLVGRAWAVVFARAGLDVALADRDAAALAAAPERIAATLAALAAAGLVDDPEGAAGRIVSTQRLAEALDGASYVQECGPEDVGIKRAIFAELDRLAPPETILASSTSGIVASLFDGEMARPERALVAHPVNPPSLVPLVEVAPSPQTAESVVARTMALMEAVGQSPILVRREIEGFVLNRLQGALLNEALRLYRDGFASAEDIDRAVRDGLGRRWAFMGPLETIDLNAPGGAGDYAARYGGLYRRIDARRDDPPWDGEVIDRLVAELRARRPAAALEARQAWRDRRLVALTAHLRAAATED